MKDDRKISFAIEYRQGNEENNWRRGHPADTFEGSGYQTAAEKRIKQLREWNARRDDVPQRRTDHCWMTTSGSWKDYQSAATSYRLVKITREVIDESEDA